MMRKAWGKWRNWSLFLVGLLCLGLFAPAAHADPLNIGSIVVDTYSSYSNGTVGGVTFTIHYQLNDNFNKQTCCTLDSLHWIQLVTSSAATGFTPTPNRPFIDPRQGQDIGGGVGDGLPFYDVTYTNSTLATQKVDGTGPYVYDKPAVLLTRGPYSFTADTVLACVEGNHMCILGGVQWGFTIGADQTTVTALPMTDLSDTAALRDAFNTALAQDFPQYGFEACDCDNTVTRPTPEPSSLVLGSTGLAGLLLLRRRRHLWHVAHDPTIGQPTMEPSRS
jgi:MYXO-CTERM domain-containing protein